MVRRSRRIRLFPFQGVGRVARPRLWQGAGELLRDAGRAAHGDAGTDLHPQRVLRQGCCDRARRQRLCLRPLRIPEYRLGNIQQQSLGDMVFSPTQVKFAYAKSETLPRVLQAMRIPARLLGRMPEEPAAAHAGRRAGTQRSLPRPQAVLRPCGADRGKVGGAVARGPANAAVEDVTRGETDGACSMAASGRAGGLCMIAGSAQAADEEARVLILNGTDPYLPAYLAIDSAMRASLAQETGRRDRLLFRAARCAALPGRGLRTRVDRASCQEIRGSQDRRGRRDQPTRAGVLQSATARKLWPGARLVFSGWPGEISGVGGAPT